MLSRVADSLYWMARYLERAEHSARVLAVKLEAMLDQTPEDAAEAWVRVVGALAWPMTGPVAGQPIEIARQLTLDEAHAVEHHDLDPLARDNARQVRELISTEMWEQLNRQYLEAARARHVAACWNAQPVPFLREIVERPAAVRRHHRFHDAARRGVAFHSARPLYRAGAARSAACSTCISATLPDDVPQPVRAPRYFEWITLLKQCTAFEAYCKVYTADVRPAKIAEFLIFDSEFPHSIRFAVDRVQEELGASWGRAASAARRAQAERLAGRLKASLDYGQVDELLAGDIDGFLRDIQASCKQIHQAVFDAFIGYSVDELLPG